MPDIAGYTDMQYIKGQYYRYAAAPKPVVYTGNIDAISDELLIKAMYVSKNQSAGTFPNDFTDDFLITTVKYGSNAYLQTAYMVDNDFGPYEYRRIYSNGEWTVWIGTDSYIADVDTRVQEVKDATDSCSASIDSMSGQISNISSSMNGVNNSISNLSGQISTVSSRLSTVETKTTNCGKDPVQLYNSSLSSGSVTLPNAYGAYSQYLIVAKVQNKDDASLVTQTILKKQLTTTNVSYCISDEIYYLSYYLRYSGNSVIVTFRGQNRNGSIKQVWGIY